MDKVIEIIGKVFDFFQGPDWANIVTKIEEGLVAIVKWIGDLIANAGA